jgi:c-di-GMP-binding flagellar brake protein YcgR
MATLQYLDNRQIDEVIRAAVQRQVPLSITVQQAGGWATLHSRMVDVRDGHLWLGYPQVDAGQTPMEFSPADKIGISFKLKHHKHIFTGIVAGEAAVPAEEGLSERIIVVCSPTRMHRMQRRSFLRVDVPPNRVVRVAFWLGGQDAEPTKSNPDRPVWFGRVTNLSAGGFQASCGDEGPSLLDSGETVGVRISFGAAEETVRADAQFRHVVEADGQAHVGFQFVGLAQSSEGRRALQMIGNKTAQFHREQAAGASRR